MNINGIPVLKFLFKENLKALSDALDTSEFEIEEFSSANDLGTYLSTTPAGLIIAAVTNKEDFIEIATFMKIARKVAKDIPFKVVVINFSGKTTFEKAMSKLGIMDFVEPNISTRALKFKMDFWMKSLNAQIKLPQESNVQKVFKNNDQGNNRGSEKKNEVFSADWKAPLELEDDIWLLKNDSDCKKILSRWLVRFLGPSPLVAQWIEVKPGTWRFEIKEEEKEIFVPNDGAWFFVGEQRPEFVWKENVWLFTGENFELFFKNQQKIHSRAKAVNKTMAIAKNSFFAKTKEEMILESCQKELVFKKEAQQLDDMEGKSKGEQRDEGYLSGKTKKNNFEDGYLSGEIEDDDEIESKDLEQKSKTSKDSNFWKNKNPLQKIGESDEFDDLGFQPDNKQESPLLERERKDKELQTYYKKHNEAEKFESPEAKTRKARLGEEDFGGSLNGESSTDDIEKFYDNAGNAREGDTAKQDQSGNRSLGGKSQTDALEKFYGNELANKSADGRKTPHSKTEKANESIGLKKYDGSKLVPIGERGQANDEYDEDSFGRESGKSAILKDPSKIKQQFKNLQQGKLKSPASSEDDDEDINDGPDLKSRSGETASRKSIFAKMAKGKIAPSVNENEDEDDDHHHDPFEAFEKSQRALGGKSSTDLLAKHYDNSRSGNEPKGNIKRGPQEMSGDGQTDKLKAHYKTLDSVAAEKEKQREIERESLINKLKQKKKVTELINKVAIDEANAKDELSSQQSPTSSSGKSEKGAKKNLDRDDLIAQIREKKRLAEAILEKQLKEDQDRDVFEDDDYEDLDTKNLMSRFKKNIPTELLSDEDELFDDEAPAGKVEDISKKEGKELKSPQNLLIEKLKLKKKLKELENMAGMDQVSSEGKVPRTLSQEDLIAQIKEKKKAKEVQNNQNHLRHETPDDFNDDELDDLNENLEDLKKLFNNTKETSSHESEQELNEMDDDSLISLLKQKKRLVQAANQDLHDAEVESAGDDIISQLKEKKRLSEERARQRQEMNGESLSDFDKAVAAAALSKKKRLQESFEEDEDDDFSAESPPEKNFFKNKSPQQVEEDEDDDLESLLNELDEAYDGEDNPVISMQKARDQKNITKDEHDSEIDEIVRDAQVNIFITVDNSKTSCELNDFFEDTLIMMTNIQGIEPGKIVGLDMRYEFFDENTNVTMEGEILSVEGDGEGNNFVTIKLSEENVVHCDKFMKVYERRQANVNEFFKRVKGL